MYNKNRPNFCNQKCVKKHLEEEERKAQALRIKKWEEEASQRELERKKKWDEEAPLREAQEEERKKKMGRGKTKIYRKFTIKK